MNLLIFDLDGTLIDSKADIAHAANATRRYMGMAPLEHDTISTYVGNGAPVLVRRLLGADATDADVQRALDYCIRYYGEHCLDNTALYPGVREALDQFSAAGSKLSVLTNKPVRISTHILNGLGIGGCFFRIYGGNSFDKKKPDPTGVYRLIDEAGVDRESAWMVGDSSVDVQTARNAGIKVCGVTYGFARESLDIDRPDVLVDDMREFAGELLVGERQEARR